MQKQSRGIRRQKSPEPVSAFRIDRREFIKTTSLAAGALAFGVPTLLRGQNLNSKVNVACVGAMGGKGRSDTDACASENIVALCDVDSGSDNYARQTEKYPGAKFYKDFRQMLDQMGSQIDAVTVSTPDHLHAIVASAAMKMNKAVYCQKPLTQTVYEARYLRKMAKDRKVVTQMGNQGSAAAGLRRAVETIQDGLIGQVHEVHVWTNRPVWPQGMDRPEGVDPIPDTLDWDKWIGPAPMRPYKGRRDADDSNGIYTPFNWRGWQDFGTGALGDMACHTVNLPFRALNLNYPTEIEATPLGQMKKESYPIGSKIRYQFPARKASISVAEPHLFHHHRAIEQDAVTLWWYDGGQPDGNRTQTTQYVDDATTRVTNYTYDWRNRLLTTDGEENFFQSLTYDNLGRVTCVERYDTTASGNLVARTDTLYDDLNRVYNTIVYGVGTVSGNCT